jgi:hypothetical protein
MDRLLQNVDLNEIINNTAMVNMPPGQEDLLNKISGFIDNVNADSVLRCDSECQKNRKSSELYEKYVDARENAKEAPDEVETAERNYYVFSKGDYAYNKMKEREYSVKGKNIANVLKKDFNEKYKELSLLLNNVNQQNTYNKHIDDLVKNYSNENEKLNNDIQDTESNSNVANRKALYFSQYTNYVESLTLLLYRLNIILAIIFILVSYLGKKLHLRIYQIASILFIANIFMPYKWLFQKVF